MQSFSAIKTEVVARLGNRSDINSRVERWINYAFFELLLNPRFSFFELDQTVSFATVANQTGYQVGTDILVTQQTFWFILDITDVTNQRHLSRSHFQVLDRVSSTTGQPTRYYRFGMSVFLDPTPDAAYNLRMRFRQRPADLDINSVNIFGLQTEWEEPLIVLSTIKGFEALDQRQKAQEQRQIFEAILPTRLDVPTLEDADAEVTISPMNWMEYYNG